MQSRLQDYKNSPSLGRDKDMETKTVDGKIWQKYPRDWQYHEHVFNDDSDTMEPVGYHLYARSHDHPDMTGEKMNPIWRAILWLAGSEKVRTRRGWVGLHELKQGMPEEIHAFLTRTKMHMVPRYADLDGKVNVRVYTAEQVERVMLYMLEEREPAEKKRVAG